jgi:hypothetical protein
MSSFIILISDLRLFLGIYDSIYLHHNRHDQLVVQVKIRHKKNENDSIFFFFYRNNSIYDAQLPKTNIILNLMMI